MLVDSHCHLDYLDALPEESIARAKAAGVAHMLCVGADPEHFDRVLAVVQRADGVPAVVRVPVEAVRAGEDDDAPVQGVRDDAFDRADFFLGVLL